MANGSINFLLSSILIVILPWRWNWYKRLYHLLTSPFFKILKYYRKIQKIDNKLYKLIFNLLGIFACQMIIFSASVSTSVLFYKYYLPHDAVKYPVHFNYKKCAESVNSCSHPMFMVNFEHFEWLFALSSGQNYNFYLDLTVPDSLSNHEAGMFNIFSLLLNKFGEPILSTQKSNMLRFKSPLYSWVSTLVSFPFLYLGICREEQLLTTKIFDNYQHISDPEEAGHELSVTLQTNHINVYEAFLRIEADFTGLRYYMNYYPVLSLISFLSFFYIVFSILAMIMYYQFIKNRLIVTEQGIAMNLNLLTANLKKHSVMDSKKKKEETDMHIISQDLKESDSEQEHNSSSDIETISDSSLTGSEIVHLTKSTCDVEIEELSGSKKLPSLEIEDVLSIGNIVNQEKSVILSDDTNIKTNFQPDSDLEESCNIVDGLS